MPVNELKTFELPTANNSQTVAMQCFDGTTGNKVMITHSEGGIKMQQQLGSLAEHQVCLLTSQADGTYSIFVDGNPLTVAGNGKYNIKRSNSSPDCFFISSGESYLAGNTATGLLTSQEGKSSSNNSNNYNTAIKWAFDNVD